MSKTAFVFCSVFFSFVLSFLTSNSSIANAAKYTMTVATVAPADSPWSALLTMFKEAVEKKSNNQVIVKIMLGGALGDENETVTKCSRGQIQAVAASTGALASKIPELNLVELPFLFKNVEEADHIIDTVLTKPMEKLFSDRGLILGMWNENGYRNFAGHNFKIKSPNDLKGKKMRVQESPVHMMMYKAYGAAAVPTPVTEVPQALATGNIDGFDQAVLYAIAAGWHSSVKHFTLSQHIYQPAAIVFNGKWFNTLPKDLQKIVVEEGRNVQDKGRKAVRSILPDLYDILKSEKIALHELSDSERQAFVDASKPVYAEFRKTFGAKASELLDQVEVELKVMRGK